MGDNQFPSAEGRPRARTLNGDTSTSIPSCLRQSSSGTTSGSSDESDGEGGRPNGRHPILKRSRSVPVSPNRKNVHFADCFGIPLVSVRKFFEQQEGEAWLGKSSSSPSNRLRPRETADLIHIKWNLCFQQPTSQPDFMDRVMWCNVCLENLVATQLTFLGTVKVKNLSYHKEVIVRYSLDGWKTHRDVISSYVSNSCDVSTDRFSFGIRAPENIKEGSRLEFAICYRVDGTEYWDNNYGQNYGAVCVHM